MKFNGNMKNVPAKAFKFDFKGTEFSQVDKEKRTVELMLYDGGVSKHWYWGNLAFDLDGMKLAKDKIAILYGHDTDSRLGFSTDAYFDGTFRIRGKMLNNRQARAVLDDGDAGFPFEASLRFNSDTFQVRRVPEGEKVEVNRRGCRIVGKAVVQICGQS